MGAENDDSPGDCPHCRAGEARVWDPVLSHYAHPAGDHKLKMCHTPWRAQRDLILANVARDPHYVPYCLRCRGLVRMGLVEALYWRCACGAQCDYRSLEKDGA